MNLVIKFFTIFSLMLVWIGLNGFNLEPVRLSFLIIVPIGCYLFASYLDMIPKTVKFKIGFIFYFFWLIKEILKSTYTVTKIIWSRNLNIAPVFEWIPLKNSNETYATIYANSITLTPGTVTIDIKDDFLLIHALEQPSVDDLKCGDMERRVEKVLNLNGVE